MVYCICQHVYWICHHVYQKLYLGVLHLPSSVLQRPSSSIRNNTGVHFRSLTWVYCICHQVVCISYHVNQEPHMVYCICQHVYWICHHVHQKLHLGVLHLPSSALQRPSSNIRNNTGVHFRSLTWVYCICHQVYCISYRVNQEPHLVYCICQQVYCICHHVHQKLHLGVLHLPSSVLQRPSSNIRNNTGVHFRSLTWVYCICYQVYCRGHHLTSGTTLRCTSGTSLGCIAFAIKWSAYPIM